MEPLNLPCGLLRVMLKPWLANETQSDPSDHRSHVEQQMKERYGIR